MTINQYFDKINHRFQSGLSTEHSYRGDFQLLLESLCINTDVTNEPIRIACGAPDYILTKKGHPTLPIGYIEAKDLSETIKLDNVEKSEQLIRYKGSLNNLILTNYIDFYLYVDGEKVTKISIAKIDGKKLYPLAENWPAFENIIIDFSQYSGILIKSASRLAEMMASKARLMHQVLQSVLESDEISQENSSLRDQMNAFKSILIHDITTFEFADIYAQTIAYGMFAARLHDPTLPTFTRQEASELIPKSNPFLKKLFGYIAGVEIDDRIIWIVDALADVFRITDVAAILKNFGKATRMQDPMIHFYETFLIEYNPKLRKSRGVFYTPEPVVNFIVRAVDDLLINEFHLSDGLADNSKVRIKQRVEQSKLKVKPITERDVHRVQILDPATGTGTFLAEVIRQVYSKFEQQKGVWSQYAEEHLIPRLHGFELLMASYAMAHLKLDLLLKETGYLPTKKENRLRVYLTNSLEESHPDSNTLFASWLSQEAAEANNIKRDVPIMVVIGNPPYSVSSSNKGAWIQNLLKEYKDGLNEKKINLDDDYIKFIRYSQFFIDKNSNGVIAMITNNSFLDGLTHRQMRKSLLETFDKIYIYNLHGNSKRKEVGLNGEKDENVFDIQTGVSISLFIKTSNSKALGDVFYFDIYGKRNHKYGQLEKSSLSSIKWEKLVYKPPYYFFIPKDFSLEESYSNGFKLDELFQGVSGIETKRDEFAIDFDQAALKARVQDFAYGVYSDQQLKNKFGLRDNEWKVEEAAAEMKRNNSWENSFFPCLYRPFDTRWIIYSKIILARDRGTVMASMNQENFGIIAARQTKEDFSVLISNTICTHKIVTVYDRSFIFPLYIYEKKSAQGSLLEIQNRYPNLAPKIIESICNKLKLTFTHEKSPDKDSFAPVDLLDYIYAILYSPKYRLKYQELLKIDFPRVPYPKNIKQFWRLVKVGAQLRELHLLSSPLLNSKTVTYPEGGDNVVSKCEFQENKVWINDKQFFGNVPEVAWQFHIGGYQPAQKWLKDRKGRSLSYEEVLHYLKIITTLEHTGRIMLELDEVVLKEELFED